MTHENPDNEIPYAEIIYHLNQTINGKYKATTPKTQELIRARWKEGFHLEDFQHVHKVKAAEWLNDPYWHKFLRPSTLYGTKFEGYLNQRMPGGSPLDQLSEAGRATYLAGQEVLRERREQRRKNT